MAQDIFANSPEVDLRKRWAMMQLQNASDASPVGHPLAAVARALQGAMGGYMVNQADEQDKAQSLAMLNYLPGQQPTQAAPAPAPSPASAPDFGGAIAKIESGGKYDLLGPVTKSGDRAFGKYQVMGANIGPWTKEALGREMTPQEFLASPQGQDAVFKAKFGQYAQKYGPEGAARAWFAGEGGMNDPGRKDMLGTSVADYSRKFTNALGPQVAQAGPPLPGSLPAAPGAGGPPPPAGPTPQPGLPGFNRDALVKMINDPATRSLAKSIVNQQVMQQFKQPEYKIEITPDGRVIAADTKDPTKIRTTTVPGAAEAAANFKGLQTAAEKVAGRVATNGMPATSEEASKVRTEIQGLPSYKNVAQAAPIYKTMLDSAGRDSKASDLNLVYGLGKIFDPGSVVREGEMVMVKNTSSLPDWLQGAIASLNGGAALQPATRDAIMKEAHSRMMSYKSLFDQDVGMYRGIADRNQMNHADVIPSFGEFPEYVRAKAPVPPPPRVGPKHPDVETVPTAPASRRDPAELARLKKQFGLN